MWVFSQSEGTICLDHVVLSMGYSGHDDGRNNPDMQGHKMLGPIPRGFYDIGPPQNTETHGPCVLRLTPDPTNEMFGRSGFLIHGDNLSHDASLGCIIAHPKVRQQMWDSGNHRLEVIA